MGLSVVDYALAHYLKRNTSSVGRMASSEKSAAIRSQVASGSFTGSSNACCVCVCSCALA